MSIAAEQPRSILNLASVKLQMMATYQTCRSSNVAHGLRNPDEEATLDHTTGRVQEIGFMVTSPFFGNASTNGFKWQQQFDIPLPLEASPYGPVDYRTDIDSATGYSQGLSPAQLALEAYNLQPPLSGLNTKYLTALQQLLSESCTIIENKGKRPRRILQQHDPISVCTARLSPESVLPDERRELESREIQLLNMLHEIDNNHRQYTEHVRTLVTGFDSLAGFVGATTFYTSSVLKAMSQHFRRLRDAISMQLRVASRSLGQVEDISPGRLKFVAQGHKSFSLHPWRPHRGLPEQSVTVLRTWLFEHFLHPYPKDVDKEVLARQAGLTKEQVSNWFINARVRLWKPMVEEMYLEECRRQKLHSTR